MGCGGSKAANEKLSLTDEDRKQINDIAQSILNNSVQFHNTIQTVQPLGIHPNPQHMIGDPREVKTFFRRDELPPQIAGSNGGNYSIKDTVSTMKLMCQQECAKALMEKLKQKGTTDDAVKARYEKMVTSEADRAMHEGILKYVTSVFENNKNAGPNAAGANAATAAPQAPQQRSTPNPDVAAANAAAAADGGAVTRQPSIGHRSGSQGGANPNQVVLPAGKWVLAEGSPFYWSDEEKLFYHPDSAQFFDPETNKWYDPERDEWYDEEDQ